MDTPAGARHSARGVSPDAARSAPAEAIEAFDVDLGESPGAAATASGRGSPLWSVVDQGLFGASNLLSSLILARWLPTAQYGAFATALAVLFLAGVLHAALFVEPMLVLGARHRERRDAYLRLLVRGHALFALVTAAACGAVAMTSWSIGRHDVTLVIAALGLAVPCVLAAWLTRRMFYLCDAPRTSAWASALYLVLVLGGFGLARWLDGLSAASALVVMAGASAIAAGWLMVRLGVGPWPRARVADDRALLDEHWALSRWLVLVVPFEWIPGNFYYLALPTIAGLGEPALLKASMNFVQPLMQLFAALRLALTPRFVAAAAAAGTDTIAAKLATGMGVAAAAWYAVLFFFGEPLCTLVYGPGYPEAGRILRVLGVLPIVFAFGTVASGLLRARGRTRHELFAGLAASAASLGFGLPLMMAYGAMGAAVAVVVAFGTLAASRFMLLAWRRSA